MKQNKATTMEKVINFLCDIKNENNCDECPYNVGADDFQHRKPCGQQNCWVTVHCGRGAEDEEEV